MDEKPKIYKLNDEIAFRQCSLLSEKKADFGDCTTFNVLGSFDKRYFVCKQQGIHLHCAKHLAIELDYSDGILSCPKCKNRIEAERLSDWFEKCRKMLNAERFKDATLIRLDDWYFPEVKVEPKLESKYWVKANVKTDKDGDTMIVMYVGHSDSKEKAQFFIKPEKMQLSSDHKDMDPAKVLSKIEVTLKDRILKQEYDES